MELYAPPPELLKPIQPDQWSGPFWAAAAEHRLVCARCTDCGTFRMPPSPFCPRCRSQSLDWPELRGHGTVFTYTVVHHAVVPALRDFVPYAVAAVTLPDADGVRLVGNVLGVDSEELVVGLGVEVEWCDVRDGISVPRFRPSPNGVSTT